MNEKTLIFLREAKKEKRLFYYSWPISNQEHRGIEICLDCDTVLLSEKFREEVENNVK